MTHELIIDGEGTVKRIDRPLFDQATDFLQDAQRLLETPEKRLTEADLTPKPEYPNLPIALLMATDIHYGSIKSNYGRLREHLRIVEETPNFYMISNGDEIDNFNVTGKWATGVYENPLPPQMQTKAMIEKYAQLSKDGKLLLMSFGNHNDFGFVSGYDWYDSYAMQLGIPVFQSGGLARLHHGSQAYDIALTHQYWGTSKLNPTNACKRFMDFEYPEADVSFLGHTHQSELLTFEKGGRERIACIGGTYKTSDSFARKKGIGGRGGQPGHTILFYPYSHNMVAIKHVEVAQQVMLSMIFEEES